MGRTHHLQETLLTNIRQNLLPDGPDVEFVVLDYNSNDGIGDWILNDPNLQPYLDSGVLKYYRTEDPEHFHMSHAKNMAHRLATGDVLCNLDADNFLGLGFSKYLERVYTNTPNAVVNPSHKVSRYFSADERGFFGRISIRREDFEQIHGYDENYQGWGMEDNDFMQRARSLGCRHLRMENMAFLGVIQHDDRARVENMVDGDHVEEEMTRISDLKHKEPLWRKFERRVEMLSKPIQVNAGGHYGEGNVTDRYGQAYVLGPNQGSRVRPFNICATGIVEHVRGRISPRVIQEAGTHAEGVRAAAE